MLTSARIQGFRSLRDVELELRPLTVLVGANGAGKSSLLTVFGMLQDYTRRGQQALPGIAQVSGLLHRQSPRDTSTVKLQLRGRILTSLEQERPYVYEIEFVSPFGSYAQVARERFQYTDGDKLALLEYPTAPNNNVLQILKDTGEPLMQLGGGSTSGLAMAAQQVQPGFDSGLGRVGREVLSWDTLSPAPAFSKDSDPAKREMRLDHGGTNLSAVLHSIYSEDYDAFSRIVDSLKSAVPEVKSVQVPVTPEGQTYVEVVEKEVAKPIPIWALSDGTIALLQLFTVLEGSHRAPLMLLEEPENFVHPGLLEILVDSMRRASETSQLLVTTHSPYMLDRLKPSEVVVVEKSGGNTTVHAATDTAGLAEASAKLTLGQLWTSGAIGGVP